MAQCADFTSRDVDFPHVEELDIRYWLAIQFVQNLRGIGALNLIAAKPPNYGHIWGNGPFIPRQRNVISAGLRMVLHPVVDRGSAHEKEFILIQVEENGVADHVSVVVASDKLLRFIDSEILKSVDA